MRNEIAPSSFRLESGGEDGPCHRHHSRNLCIANGRESVHPMGNPITASECSGIGQLRPYTTLNQWRNWSMRGRPLRRLVVPPFQSSPSGVGNKSVPVFRHVQPVLVGVMGTDTATIGIVLAAEIAPGLAAAIAGPKLMRTGDVFPIAPSHHPNALSRVSPSCMVSAQHSPPSMIPHAGQVAENASHSPPKQRWDVFHEHVSRANLVNDSGHFSPEPRALAVHVESFGVEARNVVAREASRNHVNTSSPRTAGKGSHVIPNREWR